jgi:hypothetical protein
MTDLAPRRTRVVGVVALLLGAPVCAELLQAYLDITGNAFEVVFAVIFFAPLYGGAAILIREVAVRTGRGWSGRLLLAAAFGLLMTSVIDSSLFIPEFPDIDYWDDIMGSTVVGGVSVYALTTWVLGHVLMSVGAPLAVVEGLLPHGHGRPWLGPFGIVVLASLGVAIAVFIHHDPDAGAVEATALDRGVSVAGVLLLVSLAMTRWGRPLARVPGRSPGRPLWLATAGFVLMLAFDLVPISWLGVVVGWLAFTAGVALVARHARSPRWSPRHLAAFAYGGLLARTTTGFLSPPPQGVDEVTKLAQSAFFLVLVLGLGWLLWVRTREPRVTGHNERDERANRTSPSR